MIANCSYLINLLDTVINMALIPQEGQTLREWFAGLSDNESSSWLSTQSLKVKFALLPRQRQQEWLDQQPTGILEEIARGEFWWEARPSQIPPEGGWSVHLALAGRGWGKSRAGAEWIVRRCLDYPCDASGFPTEHLIVAETLADARIICAEGPSGILRALERQEVDYRYIRSPKPKIVLTATDTRIFFEGADDPDVGRGYNATSLWADELGKWVSPKDSWEQGIMPSLRANIQGDHPRAFITTTPRPNDLLRQWLGRTDGTVSVVRGSTYENLINLSTVVLRELHRRYAGTALGRQELEGEMVENLNGILFSSKDIDNGRVAQAPHRDLLTHVVVGVDPGLTGHEDGDETGIVVVGKDKDDQFYILADATIQRVGREAAIHAWTVFARHQADVLVYESNLGKAWMETVFKDAYKELQRGGMFPEDTTAPLKAVFSTQGKKLRAEPVAMRYEQGRVSHVGRLDVLEQQMLTFDPLKPGSKHYSPDRLDAMVHAVRHMMKVEKSRGQIITVADKPLDFGGRDGSIDLYF